jgi:hypothetical protein
MSCALSISHNISFVGTDQMLKSAPISSDLEFELISGNQDFSRKIIKTSRH